jgi:hypothetical protein
MPNLYYYVYIVECSDGAYYTGVTNDVECQPEPVEGHIKLTSHSINKRRASFERSSFINGLLHLAMTVLHRIRQTGECKVSYFNRRQ